MRDKLECCGVKFFINFIDLLPNSAIYKYRKRDSKPTQINLKSAFSKEAIKEYPKQWFWIHNQWSLT